MPFEFPKHTFQKYLDEPTTGGTISKQPERKTDISEKPPIETRDEEQNQHPAEDALDMGSFYDEFYDPFSDPDHTETEIKKT